MGGVSEAWHSYFAEPRLNSDKLCHDLREAVQISSQHGSHNTGILLRQYSSGQLEKVGWDFMDITWYEKLGESFPTRFVRALADTGMSHSPTRVLECRPRLTCGLLPWQQPHCRITLFPGTCCG